jgi:hypothetical protein
MPSSWMRFDYNDSADARKGIFFLFVKKVIVAVEYHPHLIFPEIFIGHDVQAGKEGISLKHVLKRDGNARCWVIIGL